MYTLLCTRNYITLMTCLSCLYFHSFGLDDVDLVPVAAPHFIMHHRHAADGVMRTTQVQQVVVGQIPLTVYVGLHHNTRSSLKGSFLCMVTFNCVEFVTTFFFFFFMYLHKTFRTLQIYHITDDRTYSSVEYC